MKFQQNIDYNSKDLILKVKVLNGTKTEYVAVCKLDDTQKFNKIFIYLLTKYNIELPPFKKEEKPLTFFESADSRW